MAKGDNMALMVESLGTAQAFMKRTLEGLSPALAQPSRALVIRPPFSDTQDGIPAGSSFGQSISGACSGTASEDDLRRALSLAVRVCSACATNYS